MMNLLCLLMATACLAGVHANECDGLTEEQIAKLKEMHVTDDVHDKMVGEFYNIWGPKPVLDKDAESCFRLDSKKDSDTELTGTIHMNTTWFEGQHTRIGKLTKVENGVYLMKNSQGEDYGKMYVLAADGNILSKYICMLKPVNEGSKHRLPHVSTVEVRKEAVKTPMDADVQAAVDAAVKKIHDADATLMGEVAQYHNFDC